MIKKFSIAFIVEGILSFLLAAILFYGMHLSHSIFILSIPFDLVGKGLRWLSLNSAFGNVISFVLYTVLSTTPLFLLFLKTRHRKPNNADLLLLILSGYTFYMLYEFINPQLMLSHTFDLLAEESMIPMVKLSFAIIFYTLMVSYLILSMISHLKELTSEDKLSTLCIHLSRILMIMAGIYTFYFFYFSSFDLFQRTDRYFVENRELINLYYPIFLYLLEALPIILSILTLLSGIHLLNAMVTDHMQEMEYLAARKMGEISRKTVYITVLCNILSNTLPFLLSNQLNNTDYNLDLSLTPLIIAFLAMILSGYFKETKELYDDNNMII